MSRALITAVLAASLLWVPASADAEVARGPEPVGDTIAWSYAGVADPLCDTPTAVDSPPEAASSDLAGISVRHKRYQVALTARFAAPQPHSLRALEFHVDTPRDQWVLAFLRDGEYRTVDQMPEPHWRRRGFDTDGDGVDDCVGWMGSSGWSPCPDRPHASFSADRLRLTVTVKRYCLGNPRWIRAGADSNGQVGQTVVTDTWDPSAPDTRDTVWDPRVHVYGPRVLAGPQGDLTVPPATSGRAVQRTMTRSANGLVVR